MEAAPRPSTEPLPDLPVEEPADAASAVVKAPAAASASSEATPAPASKAEGTARAATDTAGTQTLELMDPEMLLATDDALTPATPQTPADEAPQVLEVDPDAPLTLEDPAAVEKLLAAPPPAAPPRNPSPASAPARSADDSMLTLIPDGLMSASAKPSAPASPAPSAAPSPAPTAKTANAAAPAAADTPAFVPLARRASLSAAAKKLAAASPAPAASPSKPSVATKPVAPPASVTALKPNGAPGAAAAPSAKASPSTTPRPSAIPVAQPAALPEAGATAPPDAPSLASWANARAAAAASAKTPKAPATPTAAPAAKPAKAPPPAEKTRTAAPAAPVPAPVPAPAPAAAVVTPSRGMDRDFIARNQVVERYLLGKLPIKAATDFERYCKEHPELLDELGLPERVNAGLRLLEASGKPEPWQEESRPLWQQPMVTLGLAGFAGVLALTLAIVAASSAGKTHKILDLQTQVAERTLDPAASTRVIRLLPNRSGATNAPAITIGGGREAQLADLRLDESRSPYRDFRVTIDRIDQGRVMVIDNLSKDSNGHLRIALNSSALGPGNYLFTIEGLTTRLEPQPDSWVTVGVAQR